MTNFPNLIFGKHKGITIWNYIVLASFFLIAVAMSVTIVSSGVVSTDNTKEVLSDAFNGLQNNLKIAGAITAVANVQENKLIAISVPILPATEKSVFLDESSLKVLLNLVKIENNQYLEKNVFKGILYHGDYNSLNAAIEAAKESDFLELNPFLENQNPSSPSSFIYWINNKNNDKRIDGDELAVLAVIFAQQASPSSSEWFSIEIKDSYNTLLEFEKTVPPIETAIMLFR